MSRRRSKSTPEARSGGPVTPSAIASAADKIPHALQPIPEDRIARQQIRILVDLLRQMSG